MRINKIIELLQQKYGMHVRIEGETVYIGQMKTTLKEVREKIKQ